MSTRILLLCLVIGALWRAPFLFAAHREGDEVDARALVSQLAHGEYSLQHAQEIQHSARRSAYVDAELYHHPPLYYCVGWLVTRLVGPGGMYLVTFLSALAVLLLTFAIAARLESRTMGCVAVLIVLLCPVTQLSSGKVWAESFSSALQLGLVYTVYRARSPDAPPLWAAAFALGLAVTLTRQTGVFTLGFVLAALACFWNDLPVRRACVAAAAGLVLGVCAWLAITARLTGHWLPAAAAHEARPDKLPGFVLMLLRRNPCAFYYVPLLLCPAYLPSLRALRERRFVPLLAFTFCHAAGLTFLTLVAPVTYHMKYLAPALPALAIPAASQWLALAHQRPWLYGALAAAALAYALPMIYQLTIALPSMAEVDPRFFYSVFAVLPW